MHSAESRWTRKYTVRRRVRASSSPEILQAGAVKGLRLGNIHAWHKAVFNKNMICSYYLSTMASHKDKVPGTIKEETEAKKHQGPIYRNGSKDIKG